jgi:hypothetical protein
MQSFRGDNGCFQFIPGIVVPPTTGSGASKAQKATFNAGQFVQMEEEEGRRVQFVQGQVIHMPKGTKFVRGETVATPDGLMFIAGYVHPVPYSNIVITPLFSEPVAADQIFLHGL